VMQKKKIEFQYNKTINALSAGINCILVYYF